MSGILSMWGVNKTLKAVCTFGNLSELFSLPTFKGVYPANQNYSLGKCGTPQETQDGFPGGLLMIFLEIEEGKKKDENNPKLPFGSRWNSRAIGTRRRHQREIIICNSSLFWNQCSLCAHKHSIIECHGCCFISRFQKRITSCIGIGDSTRCDEVSIVLLSAWKILLMVDARWGLTDPNWPNSCGYFSVSQTL